MLKVPNSAYSALEEPVGSKTQIDPGGRSKGRFLVENHVTVRCGLSATVVHGQG